MIEAHLKSAQSVEPYIVEMYEYAKRECDYFILGKPFGISKLLKHLGYSDEIVERGYILPEDNKHFDHVEKTLGNSLGVAEGIALANPDKKVFCFISDSQLFMGPTLEAILSIGAKNLKNIILAVDHNKLGSKGPLPRFDFRGVFYDWYVEDLFDRPFGVWNDFKPKCWVYHSYKNLRKL